MREYTFRRGVPVWEKGRETEKNYHLIFRSVISGHLAAGVGTKIALTASSMYQLFVNGHFVAEGPARAGHGYYRVDEIDISGYLSNEENVVAVYVAGYYVKNFYLPRQPSFLCAEIVHAGRVLAATGMGNQAQGFDAVYHRARIRKVTRYSYQRTFSEAYALEEGYNDFICSEKAVFTPVELVSAGQKAFICREVPYPSYRYIAADQMIARGSVVFAKEPLNPIRDRIVMIEDPENGYRLEELEISNCDEIDKGIYSLTMDKNVDVEGGVWAGCGAVSLAADTFAIFALPVEKTGFLRLELEASDDLQLMAVFDELLTEGDVSIHRMSSINSVIWKLKKGTYSLITNEPYSMKYIKLINKSKKGVMKVKAVGLTEYAFDYQDDGLNSENQRLNQIYSAAVESFRQNTLDIYMDCPSRERAGWLCDSFFTARVEFALTGKSLVEKNFLENFIYNDGFHGVPEGMLPMCYPADFEEPVFIPQWAMWYVLELEEYLDRSKDRELIEASEEKVRALLAYFERFENEDGLLEDLESWCFIEWSKANEFVNGVNYPTNMLYAKMLRAAAALYGGELGKSCLEKAGWVTKKVIEQSCFDGFFHDHAIRQEDGRLRVAENDVTETCQYYAFFCETASPADFPELWNILLKDFGPDRAEKGLWKQIYPSNAFIGYYLRLDLLARDGYVDRLLEDIEGFFGYMAEQTGTLWEFCNPSASCNHGFASHAVVWLKNISLINAAGISAGKAGAYGNCGNIRLEQGRRRG